MALHGLFKTSPIAEFVGLGFGVIRALLGDPYSQGPDMTMQGSLLV